MARLTEHKRFRRAGQSVWKGIKSHRNIIQDHQCWSRFYSRNQRRSLCHPGCLLHVRLPPASKLSVLPHSVIGLSGTVSIDSPRFYESSRWYCSWSLANHFQLVCGDVLLEVLWWFKRCGATKSLPALTLKIFSETSDECTEALISPKSIGDIVTIRMNGSRSFHIRKGSFLACASGVSLRSSLRNSIGGGFDFGFGRLEARGCGTLVLHGKQSAIFRLVLQKNEEYFVNPRLVALCL